MTRLEIAVSLIGQNYIVSDETIRNALNMADRILELHSTIPKYYTESPTSAHKNGITTNHRTY